MSNCREFVNGCCKDNYLQILVIPVYKKGSLGHLDIEVFKKHFAVIAHCLVVFVVLARVQF